MNLVTWGTSPWGEPIILHADWSLLWAALAAGAVFAVGHALWARRQPAGPEPRIAPEVLARTPAQVKRHSLGARLFHWVMAAAMLTLLATAFLPKAGWPFPWVTVHWSAGLVLLASFAFHIVHAACCMDLRAIWPERTDWAEIREVLHPPLAGQQPYRPGKYPLGNKLFHLAALTLGLVMAATGLAMLLRVRTPLATRDPYAMFSDPGWGVVYALHGLAGLALVAMVIIHIYFAMRPEKRAITRSMLTGTMDRDFYLTHHDPARWSGGAN